MKLLLKFTQREFDALLAVKYQAQAVVDTMKSDGEAGGQLKDARQLEVGCSVIDALLMNASK